MRIARASLPALLVVAISALTACGDDDAETAANDTGATAVQTVTQTATATATAPQDEASKTTGEPATTATTTTPKQATTQSGSDAGEAPAASAPRLSGACPAVEVGIRDGEVEPTYARIDQVEKVSCALAAEIAAQWGSQQMGIGKALLPLDWDCTRGNVCSDGSRRVKFTLVRLEQ